MSEDGGKMSCAEFQAQLPELIGSGADAAADPHIQSCGLCRALLADLATIAEAARQLFPIVEPPDELWGHIESAIKIEEGKAGNGSAKEGPADSSLADPLPSN